MNEAVDVYRELYYEGGVSSVYFWDLDDGFAGVVLLKKGEFGLDIYTVGWQGWQASRLTVLLACSGLTECQGRRRLGLDTRLRSHRPGANGPLSVDEYGHPASEHGE